MTEQDEIRRLKELIAKQQLQLAEKDEIIRKQNKKKVIKFMFFLLGRYC